MHLAFARLKIQQDDLSKADHENATCKKQSEEVSYNILHTIVLRKLLLKMSLNEAFEVWKFCISTL